MRHVPRASHLPASLDLPASPDLPGYTPNETRNEATAAPLPKLLTFASAASLLCITSQSLAEHDDFAAPVAVVHSLREVMTDEGHGRPVMVPYTENVYDYDTVVAWGIEHKYLASLEKLYG